MDNIDQIVIANITALMEKAGWNQRKLAVEANMDPVQLNRILKGKKKAGRVSLNRLATALKCTVEDIYSGPIASARDSGVEFSGKEMIKQAMREALLEGPLPMKFEHPEAMERLKVENADLKAQLNKQSELTAQNDHEADLLKAFRSAGPGRRLGVLFLATQNPAYRAAYQNLESRASAALDKKLAKRKPVHPKSKKNR